ncbi:MAG: hypothetical protein AAF417_20780 [Pseudomonadota bacterium]
MTQLGHDFPRLIFNYGWTHHFTNSETVEEQRAWLVTALAVANSVGVELATEFRPGEARFGFKSNRDRLTFGLNMFGNAESPGEYIHRHTFLTETPSEQQAWVKAACAHLELLGIRYEIDTQEASVQFAFDHFADEAFFHEIIARGHIRQTMALICEFDDLQKPSSQQPGPMPRPGLDRI